MLDTPTVAPSELRVDAAIVAEQASLIPAQRFLDGRMIPFLGAGASSYEGTFPAQRPPNVDELIDRLAREAGLAVQARKPGERPLYDLPRVASYYQLVARTRLDLDDRMRRLAGSPQYRPNRLHRMLARAAKYKPMLIVTTNYDQMMETALHQAGADYEVVATAADQLAYSQPLDEEDRRDETAISGDARIASAGMIYRQACHGSDFEAIDPRQLAFDLTQRSVLYKVHGSVPAGGNWDGGYLVAEEDYARFLGRMDREHIYPHRIKNIIGMKRRLPTGRSAILNSLLFLGYSLNDWNLRVLMDELGVGQGRPGEERHYAVMRSHDDVAKRLLDKRNIAPCVMDLSEVVADLERQLTEAGVPELQAE